MVKEFYTEYGWKGSEYEQTKNLSLKEIAKRIKHELKDKFQGFKFSVRTHHYSGGCSIRLYVTGVPEGFRILRLAEPEYAGEKRVLHTEEAEKVIKQLYAIVNKYRYDDSDGMIDYFSTNFYCSPSFDFDLEAPEYKALGIGD